MKPSFKNYTHPRPVWIKVVGDTLLYAGNATGFASLVAEVPLGAFIGFGVGILAYFFSNLYKAIDAELVRQETYTKTVEVTETVTTKPITNNQNPNSDENNVPVENKD